MQIRLKAVCISCGGIAIAGHVKYIDLRCIYNDKSMHRILNAFTLLTTPPPKPTPKLLNRSRGKGSFVLVGFG